MKLSTECSFKPFFTYLTAFIQASKMKMLIEYNIPYTELSMPQPLPPLKTKGRGTRMARIGAILGANFDKLVADLYVNKKLCGSEISDLLYQNSKIRITKRSIQRRLKAQQLTRPQSESIRRAIMNGRKRYDHLRKPIKSVEFRRGISLKLRFQTMKRDNFRCVLCGKGVKDDELLEVDHLIPVVSGGTNSPENLRTLCRSCNRGKMLAGERHL